jgi:transcriptional regulator with XRE-family HTH domain
MATQTIRRLLLQARATLGLSQKDLARTLGASERTGERWSANASSPSADQLCKLARMVHPIDVPLARSIAREAGTSLEELELTPPAETAYPVERLVDSVICAAADAMDTTPRAIRPALLAAFTRARELRLDARAVEAALSPPPAPRKRPVSE